MSQVKAYNPEIAKIVGIQASLLLQHIKYWIESYEFEKLIRTNQQISDDFKGTLSTSQIQRAKKKLVDAGLIIISHEKGYTRTTHFTLTEKAKSLFGAVVEKVKKVVKKVKPTKPTSMEASFKEQGTREIKRHIPEDVREKLSGLFKKKKVEVVPEPTFFDGDDEDTNCDDYFSAIDAGFSMVQENESSSLSLNDLMSKAFNSIPNVKQLEKNRKELELAVNFKEDF